MRPSSIVSFDRLYLVATGLGLLNSFMSLDQLQARIDAMPQLKAVGIGSGFIYGSIAIGLAITLALWFAVAYRRSVVAKWVLVAFTALAIVNLLSLLFRADASRWLAGSDDAEA